MATLSNNLYLQGARGMLGTQLVYRTLNGKTVVSSKPERKEVTSEVQKKNNDRFRQASEYAKAAIRDEALGPIYAQAAQRVKKFGSAYHLALTDFMLYPEIGDISLSNRNHGTRLLIEAYEDPQLASVSATILDKAGVVLDQGNAHVTTNEIEWEFLCPIHIPQGAMLQVQAYDLPGNMTIKTFDLDMI